MALKDFEVIEYFLDKENNILGYQLWPLKKYPQFEKNPEPLEEMTKDGFKDEYGRWKWKFINLQFVLNDYGNGNGEKALYEFNNMTLVEKFKKIISGINSKNNQDYIDFVDLINRIE